MTCPKGGEHYFLPTVIDGIMKGVCSKCERVISYQPVKSQQQLLEERKQIKQKLLEILKLMEE